MRNKELLSSYADAMSEASCIIEKENPDFLIVPMMGSVPFIDVMTIVDRNFDNSKAIYMPASSRIRDVSKVVKKWYRNFLNEKVEDSSNPLKVMGIDEVVSGNSMVRCFKNIDVSTQSFRKSLKQKFMEELHSPNEEDFLPTLRKIDILTDNQYSFDLSQIKSRFVSMEYKSNKEVSRKDSRFVSSLIKKSLEDKFTYKSIGVEDSKGDGKRNKEYSFFVDRGRVLPVGVKRIITMDKPSLCPPQYKLLKNPSKHCNVVFSPEIVGFNITPEYLELLSDLARYVGVDPSNVSPVNMPVILDSKRYL